MADEIEVNETVPVSAINAPTPQDTAVEPAETPPAEKAEGEGKETKAEDAKGDKAKVGAPEKYDTFKFPEGVEVDQPALDKFLPLAKELNLTQEQAQKLIDFQSEYIAAATKTAQSMWDTLQSDWVKAAKSDKEIGGQAFNENVGHAAKAIKQFGTPELKAALDATGVGNHPEFIRVFAKIGRAISEDKFHVSNAEQAPSPKTWAETLFPNQGKQGA